VVTLFFTPNEITTLPQHIASIKEGLVPPAKCPFSLAIAQQKHKFYLLSLKMNAIKCAKTIKKSENNREAK